METRISCVVAIAILMAVPLSAAADSIGKNDIDTQKIFWGDPQKFSKPAEISFVALVEKTPEYKTIVKEKLDSSGARYWILMTEAQERVTKSIVRVARKNKFDLVCDRGYLEPLGFDAPDITKLVEKDLTGKSG